MYRCGTCLGDSDAYCRFISCSCCKSIFHGNCIDPKIKGVCIDALQTANSGLQWFCVKCRGFLNAVLLNKLNKFNETFMALSSSLNDVNNLFKAHANDYHELHKLVDVSVNASSNGKKVKKGVLNRSRAKSSSSYDLNSKSKLNDAIKPSKWSLFDTTDDDYIHKLRPRVVVNEVIDAAIAPFSVNSCHSSQSTLSESTAKVKVIEHVLNTSTYAEALSEPPVLDSLAESAPESSATLEVVLPQKTIFLSRLKYGTSSVNIMNYIETAGVDINKIRCICLTAENLVGHDTASFKLLVPMVLFKKLVDPHFWPANILFVNL